MLNTLLHIITLKIYDSDINLLNISMTYLTLLQYYYAHAPKNFNTEGAEIFKGDGLIYGGDPVLLGQREVQKK